MRLGLGVLVKGIFVGEKDKSQLGIVYRATAYLVDGPSGRFTIRVGERCTQVEQLIVELGATCWAFITALNPGSRQLSSEENQSRHRALEERVCTLGYAYYPGEGVGDSGEWPAEESLFVLGIGEEEAISLGREFGQAAIVVGEIGGEAELVWMDG